MKSRCSVIEKLKFQAPLFKFTYCVIVICVFTDCSKTKKGKFFGSKCEWLFFMLRRDASTYGENDRPFKD